MANVNVLDSLEERGLIDQITSDKLKNILEKPIKFYLGFDPTADSLHLGHLLGIVVMTWFAKFGHQPYALIGGATGRIGDPSGKSIERPFLEDKVIAFNAKILETFLQKILEKSTKAPIVAVNNNDWFSKMFFIDFLRDVGKHFRLGSMLSKESVKLRLASEEGMSFTEFSYQILQAYDFYYLHQQLGISLQLGGSDQWGNITAGIELGHKLSSANLFGMTFPLLTRSDGKKFGKSESGAIWLDKSRLSPYEFYQYLVKIPDRDVVKMMKMLTFMEMEEIYQIERAMSLPEYEPNTAQKKLAEEVTRFVHGEEGLAIALQATETALPGKKAELDVESLEKIEKDIPHATLRKEEVLGQKFTEIASLTKLTTSKSEASRLIQNQGAYLNEKRIDDESYRIDKKDLIGDKYLLLGSGKKKKLLIKIVS
jgi:tyrosyl-tRNA synthetase